MKKAEIEQKLKELGLPTTGNKMELEKRLEEALGKSADKISGEQNLQIISGNGNKNKTNMASNGDLVDNGGNDDKDDVTAMMKQLELMKTQGRNQVRTIIVG